MKIENPYIRLQQFWGAVDNKHIGSITKYLVGNEILDVGCGMGSTTYKLQQQYGETKNILGIDYEAEEIEKAKKLFPDCDFSVANCESLPFENERFDSIILRDSLHHLYEESDFEKVKLELLRVLKPNGLIITLDPNVSWWMRFLRKISKHEDAECSYDTAMDIFKNQMQMQIEKVDFHTIFSLPLSGGYVGVNFIPNWKFLWTLLLKFESLLEFFIKFLGLGKHCTWRYLIVAKK